MVLVVQALPSSSGGAATRHVMLVHARGNTGAFTTARDLRRAVPGIPFPFAYPSICSSTSGERLPACSFSFVGYVAVGSCRLLAAPPPARHPASQTVTPPPQLPIPQYNP